MKKLTLAWGWLLSVLFVKPIIAFAKWEDARERASEEGAA